MLSKQEIFNRVWTHFVVNKNQRSNKIEGGEPQCQYIVKTYDGTELRCAIGIFFEEGEYSPDMEGSGISLLIRKGLLPPSFCDRMGVDAARSRVGVDAQEGFLQRLQTAHDESSDEWEDGGLSSIEKNLRRVASDYTLDIPRDERMSY